MTERILSFSESLMKLGIYLSPFIFCRLLSSIIKIQTARVSQILVPIFPQSLLVTFRQRWRNNQYQLSIKMLCSPNQELREGLLSPLPSRKQQKEACLKRYIQLYEDYQVFIVIGFRSLVAYCLVHLLAVVAFEVARRGKDAGVGLIFLPDIFWGGLVLRFRWSFTCTDPHLFGVKCINLYKIKFRATYLYHITIVFLILLTLARNCLLFSSYILLIADFALLLLSFRVILKVFNFQNQAEEEIRAMKEQQFYFVPVIKKQQMQEPFHMDDDEDANEGAKMRKQRCQQVFEKYFKPLKRKQFNEYNEQEFESQLYSH